MDKSSYYFTCPWRKKGLETNCQMRRFEKELNNMFWGDRLFRVVTLETQLTVCQDRLLGLLGSPLITLKTGTFAEVTRTFQKP